MKKRSDKPFLYRYRYVIGYLVLMLVFFGLLSFLPSVAPGGLSSSEMSSAVAADSIHADFISQGNVVNLPYLLLQKASISIFGLTLYSIKLPSIIMAVLTGLFLVLLLNRWFKNDVAIVGSILTTLSVAFLFLAGSGTPTIMYVFWLALILWLGSKIVGNENTHPLLVISFFFCIAMSLYTPHMFYIALGIALAGLTHPHLRFALKQVRIWHLILCGAIFILVVSPLVLGCIFNPSTIQSLIFMKDPGVGRYIENISTAFAPFFSFVSAYDSIYLAPLFGLATVALVIIGALASIGKLFTSRNSVVSLLIIFSIIVSGFNQDVAISIILPITILSAAGLESIIQKWHSLFPENPYAHVLGIMPVVIVVLVIVGSDLSHFIFGYHYSPQVAKNFNDDITLISQNLEKGSILVVPETHQDYEFYKLLERHNEITVTSELPQRLDIPISYLEVPSDSDKLKLKQIITSPKSRNSARLYLYEKNTTEKQGS